MGASIDIYDYPKRIAREIQRIRESKDITEGNKQAILDFSNYASLLA